MATVIGIRIPRFEMAEIIRADPVGMVGSAPIVLHQVYNSLFQLGYIFHVGDAWVGKRPTNRADQKLTAEGSSDVLYQCRGHERPVLWVSNHWEDPCEHVCEHIRAVHSLPDFSVGRVSRINHGNARHIRFKGIDSSGTSSQHPIYLAHLLPLDDQRLGYTFFAGEAAVDKFPVGLVLTAWHQRRNWTSMVFQSLENWRLPISGLYGTDGYPTRGDRYELLRESPQCRGRIILGIARVPSSALWQSRMLGMY